MSFILKDWGPVKYGCVYLHVVYNAVNIELFLYLWNRQSNFQNDLLVEDFQVLYTVTMLQPLQDLPKGKKETFLRRILCCINMSLMCTLYSGSYLIFQLCYYNQSIHSLSLVPFRLL